MELTHLCGCSTRTQRVNTLPTRSRKNNQNATRPLSLEQTKSNSLFSPVCIFFIRVGLSLPFLLLSHLIPLTTALCTIYLQLFAQFSNPIYIFFSISNIQSLRISFSISPILRQSSLRFSSSLSFIFNCC